MKRRKRMKGTSSHALRKFKFFNKSDDDYLAAKDDFGEDGSDLEAEGGEPTQQDQLKAMLSDYYGPNAKYNKPAKADHPFSHVRAFQEIGDFSQPAEQVNKKVNEMVRKFEKQKLGDEPARESGDLTGARSQVAQKDCDVDWNQLNELHTKIDEAQTQSYERSLDSNAKFPKYYPDRQRFKKRTEEEMKGSGAPVHCMSRDEAEDMQQAMLKQMQSTRTPGAKRIDIKDQLIEDHFRAMFSQPAEKYRTIDVVLCESDDTYEIQDVTYQQMAYGTDTFIVALVQRKFKADSTSEIILRIFKYGYDECTISQIRDKNKPDREIIVMGKHPAAFKMIPFHNLILQHGRFLYFAAQEFNDKVTEATVTNRSFDLVKEELNTHGRPEKIGTANGDVHQILFFQEYGHLCTKNHKTKENYTFLKSRPIAVEQTNHEEDYRSIRERAYIMVLPIKRGEDGGGRAARSRSRSVRPAEPAEGRPQAEIDREKLKKASAGFQSEFNLGYVGQFQRLAELMRATQGKQRVGAAERDKRISAHEYVDTFQLIKMAGEDKLVLIWAHADHPTWVVVPDENISAIEFKREYELAHEDQRAVQNLKKCISFKFNFTIISRQERTTFHQHPCDTKYHYINDYLKQQYSNYMAKLPAALAEYTTNFVGGGTDAQAARGSKPPLHYSITRNFSNNKSLVFKEDFRQAGASRSPRSQVDNAINASELVDQERDRYVLKILQIDEPTQEIEDLDACEVHGDLDLDKTELRLRIFKPGQLKQSEQGKVEYIFYNPNQRTFKYVKYREEDNEEWAVYEKPDLENPFEFQTVGQRKRDMAAQQRATSRDGRGLRKSIQLTDDDDIERQRQQEIHERFDPVFVGTPSWKFDFYEAPALILNNESKSVYLVLIDLRKKKVTSSIMLDINNEEYKYIFREERSMYVPPGKTVQEALEALHEDPEDEFDHGENDSDCPSLEIVQSSEAYFQLAKHNPTSKIVQICQNFHAVIALDKVKRFLLFEFQVIWKPENKDYGSRIQMIGRKELFASTLDFHTMKVKSLYNTHGCLSGIKFESNAPGGNIALSVPVPNNEEKDAAWCHLATDFSLVSTRYKKLYLYSKFEGVLVDSQYNTKRIYKHRMTPFFVNYTLLQSVYTCLNMIEFDMKEDIMSREFHIDVFQPIAKFNGMSLLDLFFNQPSAIYLLLENQGSFIFEQGYVQSMLQRVTATSRELAEKYQAQGIMRKQSEISMDFVFQNIVSRCVQRNMNKAGSLENNMISCDIILEYVLNQKEFIPNNERVLQMIFPEFAFTTRRSEKYIKFLSPGEEGEGDFSGEARLAFCSKCSLSDKWLDEEEAIYVANLKGKYANQNPDAQVVQRINEEVGEEKGSIQVEFSYIDFRYMNWRMDIQELMQTHYSGGDELADVGESAEGESKTNSGKMQNLMDEQVAKAKEMLAVREETELWLSTMMIKVLDKYGDQIANLPDIQFIINYQFKETQSYFYGIAFWYMVGFLAPFVIQAFSQDELTVYCANISCLCTQLFFLYIEVVQVFDEGPGDYINDFWNILDITGVVAFIAYLFVRKQEIIFTTIVRDQDEPVEEYRMDANTFTLRLMTSFILFTALMKLLFFLRINEGFGSLIQLLGESLKAVQQFFAFFMVWEIFFFLQSVILGMEIDEEDYAGMPYMPRTMIQTWRNAAGDLAAPKYDAYLDDQGEIAYPEHGVIIFMCWLMWFMNIIFVTIMLFNFLIGIVCNEYDNVEAFQEFGKFGQRADFNREYRLFKNSLRFYSVYDCLIYSYKKEEEATVEPQGVVQQIKNTMKESIASVKDSMKYAFNDQKRVQAAAKQDIEERVRKVGKNLQQEMKKTLETKIDKCQKKCEQLEERVMQQAEEHSRQSGDRVAQARTDLDDTIAQQGRQVQRELADLRQAHEATAQHLRDQDGRSQGRLDGMQQRIDDVRERQEQMNNTMNQSLNQILALLQNGLFEGTIEMEREGD